jgi:hypothetical protein
MRKKKSKQDEEISISHLPKDKAKTKESKGGKLSKAKTKLKKNKKMLEKIDPGLELLEKKLEDAPPDEKEYVKEYIYIYRKLKKLTRQAEKRAMTSGQAKDYYSYCTLVSQQREVIADIRSIVDLSGQVDILIQQALQPMVSQLGQVIVQSFYQHKRLLMDVAKEKELQFALKTLDGITRDVSQAIQMHYVQATNRIQQILVGQPEQQAPKKKRH